MIYWMFPIQVDGTSVCVRAHIVKHMDSFAYVFAGLTDSAHCAVFTSDVIHVQIYDRRRICDQVQ